jgi:hypothetical protein
MSAIKIKKLTLQYSYLLLEKDDVMNICQKQEKEISQYIKENYPEKYKKIYEQPQLPPKPPSQDPPKTKETEESPKIEEGEQESPNKEELPQENKTSNKNSDLRVLYRRIAAKTHPDKTGNDLLSGEFSAAAAAYASNDLAALLNLAGHLNIELISLSSESLILLENNVNNLDEEIIKKKSTGGWRFYKAKTDGEKDVIIQKIMSNLLRNK